jgi:ketosteroid isomerase-like protein
MTWYRWALLAAVCGDACVSSASRTTAPPPPSEAAAAVRQLEAVEWARASRAKDTAWFARHVADELVMTTGRTGRVTTKAEELAEILSPTTGGGEDRVEDLRVQAYGVTAVATFRLVSTGADRTGPYRRTARYTEVWIYRDARWQLAASHSSLIRAALP